MRKFQKIIDEINRLSRQQTKLKPQRKRANFKGERVMSAFAAQVVVAHNKNALRHLHHAYAELRGKTLPMPKYQSINRDKVDKYVKQFAVAEEEIAA